MSSELLVNVTPQETRVAVIENGLTQEVYVERESKRGLVGNIYKGRVNRVLPGMQAAFIDIGLERAAFLHASDVASPNRRHTMVGSNNVTLDPSQVASDPMFSERNPLQDTAGADRDKVGEDTTRIRPTTTEGIADLLTEGQSVLVQVIKDPLGSKGARLTTYISVPSFYLVFVPLGEGVGISQRIEHDAERERLRITVEAITNARSDPAAGTTPSAPTSDVEASASAAPPAGGYIVRTAAESIDAEKLVSDVRFLRRLWSSIAQAAAKSTAPSLVHEDLALVVRTMRELIGNEIETVRIDSNESYRRVLEFVEQFSPEMRGSIKHYDGERPIFDLYGVEDEIHKALDSKVQLKSGGYLVIEQTEAMTTIDVNTGAYVGRRNLEETIFKTNMEAAQSIARQLRLRNLGGIIIIDFIDMQSEDHKRQVLRVLERSLERDPMKTQISEVSSLGLVQMTRKRTRESLERVLCDPCPTCDGRGFLKSAETVCYEIFREILREARQYDTHQLLVLAAQEVIDRLVDEESANFAELEAFIGRSIRLQVEPMYTQAHYDVVLM